MSIHQKKETWSAILPTSQRPTEIMLKLPYLKNVVFGEKLFEWSLDFQHCYIQNFPAEFFEATFSSKTHFSGQQVQVKKQQRYTSES